MNIFTIKRRTFEGRLIAIAFCFLAAATIGQAQTTHTPSKKEARRWSKQREWVQTNTTSNYRL